MTTFLEAEAAGGRPRECYTFQRGPRAWRYTSADATQALSGVTFLPAAITRGPFQHDDDSGATRVTIELARSTPMAEALLSPHPAPLTVSIHRIHPGATDYATPFLAEAKAIGVAAEKVTITAETVEAAFSRPFPRTVIARTCQNALYDGRCGVALADYLHDTTVAAISGQTITVADVALQADEETPVADGYYTVGRIRLATGEDLFVTTHAGTDLTVLGPIPSTLAVDDAVSIAPGCDKTLQTCHAKFDNVRNFLGFPWLPEQNPYEGSLR